MNSVRHAVMALLPLISIVFLGCANDQDKRLEEIRFLLDKGKFSEALALAEESVTDQPGDLKAKALLAEASLASGALGGNPNCQPEDLGLIGLLACLQDPVSATETDLEIFRRVAPSDETKIAQVETATDLLVELSTSDISDRNIYLLLFLSRLFEISGATTKVGANCQFVVGFDASDQARFTANLEALPADGVNAGFPQDFGLFDTVEQIQTALEVTANGNFAAFFTNELCS